MKCDYGMKMPKGDMKVKGTPGAALDKVIVGTTNQAVHGGKTTATSDSIVGNILKKR